MFLLDLLRKRSREGDHHKDQVHYLTTLRGVIGMLRNPEGTESVFDIEDGLKDIRAADGVVTRVSQDPEVVAMMSERYLAEPVDLDELERLPDGSLGNAFARHIIDHGFDPDYYRKLDVETDLDWVMMRMRQTHDIWHVVTGIGTSRLGEMAVKAFELAQTWRPLAAVITCGGMMRYLMKDPDQLGDAMTNISHGYQLGRLAKPFLAQKWELGWERSLADWRIAVNLPAEVPAAGQWQPPCMPTENA
jgi:ubiquinone biosynthesis protein Coq4